METPGPAARARSPRSACGCGAGETATGTHRAWRCPPRTAPARRYRDRSGATAPGPDCPACAPAAPATFRARGRRRASPAGSAACLPPPAAHRRAARFPRRESAPRPRPRGSSGSPHRRGTARRAATPCRSAPARAHGRSDRSRRRARSPGSGGTSRRAPWSTGPGAIAGGWEPGLPRPASSLAPQRFPARILRPSALTTSCSAATTPGRGSCHGHSGARFSGVRTGASGRPTVASTSNCPPPRALAW